MGRVVDAIHWDGITPVISLFVVPSAAELPDLAEVWTGDTPRRTRMYRLEDDREAATIRVVYEYDFEFETLPVQLEQDLERCLRVACSADSSVAWLAFEGSFHFDHLLDESTAHQIYGVCAAGDPPVVSLDDDEGSRLALRERLREYRIRLGIDEEPATETGG
jgi:hypothetical protein